MTRLTRTAAIDPSPTNQQELLLRAALLRGPASIESWQQWRTGTSVDVLESDSQWLLPLLYRNLHGQGVASDLLARYRNVYLHNWYKNNLTLRQGETALKSFRRAGKPVILLGGAALAIRHYESIGARPFVSLTLMDLAHASHRPPRTTEVEWRSTPWTVLDPADQLVDICVRRNEWDPRSKLFWVADAAIVIQRNLDLDWDRVTELAAQSNHHAPVTDTLSYLGERFGIGPAFAGGTR